MPNRHGDLNITEAAAYLGVSQSLMASLYEAPFGPLFLLGATKADRAAGPWFMKQDLDAFRLRLPGLIATGKVAADGFAAAAGTPKSTLAKHVPGGVVVLGG